ncbi:hypothetical protein FPZ24_13580 [Sphingomonas panacisoli]|uniref:Recombinase domain-containing protein n=1 Tax=Sphingomonas panacisoli TaxID=1813879 RepID=A0A5B8LJB4_9SPHN|nr:recombinase family protein [Sphingomonas panacisoli]QDZ08377.1 hypothetical protein FPZ24_13580 [Sphingomonas panacisoli]
MNREGIRSPRGGKWNVSTILGNRRRCTGILNNDLYIGRIVYNRQRFEKHPVTRKRVAKLNPRDDWVITEVPALAIVDRGAWDTVHNAFATLADIPPQQRRRPKRLFSGLVTCGECGGSYTVIGAERWGCSGRQNGRGCRNGATISTAQLESRVLGALR